MLVPACPNNTRIFISSHYQLMEDGEEMQRLRHHNIALLLNYVNQIDSMLLRVYSITDHKSSASMMFFPYFDIICDRLQNR